MTSIPVSRVRRLALVAGPPLLTLLVAALTLVGMSRVVESRAAEDQAHETNVLLQRVLMRLVEAETAHRGYLLTGDPAYLTPFETVEEDVRQTTERLWAVLKDRRQRERLRRIVPLVETRLGRLEQGIQRRHAGPVPVEERAVRIAQGKQIMDEIRRRTAEMQEAGRRLLADSAARSSWWTRVVVAELALGALLSACLAFLINLQFARHAADLDRHAAETDRHNRELTEKNLLLEEQAVELELQSAELQESNERLQEQATELEMQAADLAAAAQAIRESGEWFRCLIENCAEAIAVVGEDGTITYESPGVTRMLGHAPQGLVGVEGTSLVHADDLPAVREAARALLQGPGADAAAEFRVRHADGSWHTLEAVAMNMLAEPAVSGVVVNARDITVRRTTEEALHKSEEQLRQASKLESVGRLAGGIAHDFNNLLTVIGGNAALLGTRLPPELAASSELSQIREASSRAASLTRQLLTFSRRHVAQPRVVDPNAVVRGLEPMLRRLISEQIEIAVSLDPSVQPVRVDPVQLEQVLMNLAVNASDAMPQGGRFVVETRNVEVDAAFLRPGAEEQGAVPAVLLAVSDNGVGMDAATQERVFEPFFTTKEPGMGTGLGLSTVYGIVQQAGGRIWLYSEPGQGTTFKIYFPPAEGAQPEAPRPAPAPAGPVRESGTILLVEDEPGVRMLVKHTLEGAGYEVLEAASPDEAFQLALRFSRRIHLLLTDMVMPGRTGKALAGELLRYRPMLATLFMSGYTDDAIMGQGVLEPGFEFIEKPFTPDQLLAKVRRVIGGSAA